MTITTMWIFRGRNHFEKGLEIEQYECPEGIMSARQKEWFIEGWRQAERRARDRMTDEERECMQEDQDYEPEAKHKEVPLKIVPLQESNYRDIATTLRLIADQIEAGEEYGQVNDCALVIQGATLDIFHMGSGNAETAHLLFACAQRKLEMAVMDHYE